MRPFANHEALPALVTAPGNQLDRVGKADCAARAVLHAEQPKPLPGLCDGVHQAYGQGMNLAQHHDTVHASEAAAY
jgi:hypothetical protein